MDVSHSRDMAAISASPKSKIGCNAAPVMADGASCELSGRCPLREFRS